MRAMALARMGDHRLPKRILSGKLEGAGKRARVSRQGKKMGGLCGRLYLNIPGQWRFENHLIRPQEVVWREGASRSMVAWRKEEDRAEENRHWKRAREGVERVFIASPEENAEKLRRFRVTNDWFILRFSKTAPAVSIEMA